MNTIDAAVFIWSGHPPVVNVILDGHPAWLMVHQYEMSIRNTFFGGKLTGCAGIYHTLNKAYAQQPPVKTDGTINNDNTEKKLSSETTGEGVELDLKATPSSNFYIIAGYGYHYMRFTHRSGQKGSNIEGERVVTNPSHITDFTAFYTLTQARLKSIILGVSIFYTGNHLAVYNNIVGQSVTGSRLIALSGFSLVDISAAYRISRFSLLCRRSNLFNTRNYLVHDNYRNSACCTGDVYHHSYLSFRYTVPCSLIE
jgi:iron complex outermembrane receptor protein